MQPNSKYSGDAAFIGKLAQYACPTPFHVVRMRFWGAISCPEVVKPTDEITRLWNGDLPTFAGEADVNNFFDGMISLWNQLAALRMSGKPLALMPRQGLDRREGLATMIRMRREEIVDGFVDSCMGPTRPLDELPPRMHKHIPLLFDALDQLEELQDEVEAAYSPEMGHEFARIDKMLQHHFEMATKLSRWELASHRS